MRYIVDSAQGSSSLTRVHTEMADFASIGNGHIMVHSDHEAACEGDISRL